jgi:folate-dependent tRNA-U54 methylase TrmFO/GidA
MDHSLLLALRAAYEQLRAEPSDKAAAAARIVCSRVCAAAACNYRPSSERLQQAWQLLESALESAAGEDAVDDGLAAAVMAAAYASAVTFSFTSREISDLMMAALLILQASKKANMAMS